MTKTQILTVAAAVAAFPAAGVAQEGVSYQRAGDMRRVAWVRPWAKAQAAAKAKNRLLLVKPILGGSNKPNPAGLPCGGVDDCEGSW